MIRNVPSDEQLRNALLKVNLGNLLERCEGLDSQVEWASVLSLGEQQRLAFARLLLARPLLALLDESTSALDEENEVGFTFLVFTVFNFQKSILVMVKVNHSLLVGEGC